MRKTHPAAGGIVFGRDVDNCQLQRKEITEEQYRGERFADHPGSLKGNCDLLNLTRPEVVEAIHLEYFRAGADMVETNTFSGNFISQADYNMQPLVSELNLEGARIARRAADLAEKEDGKKRLPPHRARSATIMTLSSFMAWIKSPLPSQPMLPHRPASVPVSQSKRISPFLPQALAEQGGKYYLQDTHSTNGTYLNGQLLEPGKERIDEV